jgi:hypothetical protein
VNALAPVPRLGAMQPDLAAIEGCILLIEDGARASRDLDATIFEALGWHVTRAAITDPRANWTVLSPLSRAALPLPRVSKRIDCAATLVPARWNWSTGRRDGEAVAWCHNGFLHADSRCLWFEGRGAQPALVLTKVALHAHRALLIARQQSAPDRRVGCSCGWVGSMRALRSHGNSAALFCPDCDRQVS